MKKRLTIWSIVLLLLFVPVYPVFAVFASETVDETAQIQQMPLLLDDAGLLDETEKTDLLARLEEISARQKMDVVIVTVGHMDGRSVEAYADDVYDYFGYGQGNTKDGVMFLIAMEEREVHMTASGRGIQAFTDAGRAYILDNCVMPLISEGEYAKAFNEFADQCDAFITQAETGKPYDGSFMPKGEFEPLGATWLLVAAVAGALITLVVSAKLKKQMKTVEFQRAANSYAVDGSFVLTGQADLFLTTRTTQTPRAKQSGTTTGSSTHTSSSGNKHSGSSRSF